MPVDAGDVLYRVRAGRIVVATGAVEQPLVFPGNDLVGVMLPAAVRRLVDDWAIKPGDARGRRRRRRRRASAVDRRARARRRRDRARSSTCASEPVRRSPRAGGSGRLAQVDGRRRKPSTATCSSPRAAASRPTRCSPRPARASSTTPRRGIFVPAELPPGVEAVGVRPRRPTRGGRVPSPSYGGGEATSASSASART